MTTIRALVQIPNGSADTPSNLSVNTWHFNSSSASATASSAHTALTTFYHAIDQYLSSQCADVANVKYYDLSDSEPRQPILESTISLTLGSGQPLPHEVAICCSYRADLISGANPARRRGRIFIGPLDADTQTFGGGDSRVSSAAITAITAAAEALAESTISSSTGWVVFSPTTAGPAPWSSGELDAASFVVTAGYVDNAYDIIRSRGLPPTTRTSWVAS